MSGAIWGAVAQGALQVADAWMQSSAQHKANRTNIKLQREQQAWEEKMSGTAIQRRADDIERAGGNRALAFVNGSEASTPTVTPARVEPNYRGGLGASSAVMLAAQLRQLNAQTKSTEADARVKNVEANIREALADKELGMRSNRIVEETEWDDIKTEIQRSIATSSAAEAERVRRSVDAIVTQAKQAAEKGDLEVKQLRNIVNVGGLTKEDKDSILRYLIDVLLRNK